MEFQYGLYFITCPLGIDFDAHSMIASFILLVDSSGDSETNVIVSASSVRLRYLLQLAFLKFQRGARVFLYADLAVSVVTRRVLWPHPPASSMSFTLVLFVICGWIITKSGLET